MSRSACGRIVTLSAQFGHVRFGPVRGLTPDVAGTATSGRDAA